jgi:hypothetical protein
MAQRTAIHVPLNLLGFSTGTWARSLQSNVEVYRKTAADNSPIMFVTLPIPPEFPLAREVNVESVDVYYSVTTAALEAAPVSVLRRKTLVAATGPTVATVTETEAITGDDTTGTAEGQYKLTITPSSPVRLDDNDEQLQVEVTFNAAATTVLDITAVVVNLEGG